MKKNEYLNITISNVGRFENITVGIQLMAAKFGNCNCNCPVFAQSQQLELREKQKQCELYLKIVCS